MNKQDGGLTIGSQKFNVVCYADDLLLCSTTVTGLQNLINIANEFIVQNGLRFNPNKSTCITFGKIPFIYQPKWFNGDDQLRNEEYLKYLGAIIGNNNSSLHITSRLSACRKSFYSLQGGGLCHKGLATKTAAHVWSATCKSILLCGFEAMFLKPCHRNELDKLQAKLVKCIVGIGQQFRTTPLLQALKMVNISQIIDINNLFLIKNVLYSNSAATSFYSLMLKKNSHIC